MKYFLLLSILILFIASGYSQKKTFNVLMYGAKSDGKTNSTIAIQKAIDAAAENGGRVIVPPGNFVTGPILLKSNVELHLEKGASILGSINRTDYGSEEAGPLISATNANRISITGSGTIDGRGQQLIGNLIEQLKAGKIKDQQWPAKAPREAARPQIITLTTCTNITIKGIMIKNSAAWVQSYVRCNNVMIDSITVESTAYWNNDGIDIVNSKNVSITNCTINADDDGICLKSEGSVPDSCVNVFVANCRIRSSANAFKLGTGSRGGFRNIWVDGLTVYDTYRSAIALEAVDGGFLENVEVKNVKATNTGSAILMKLGHRNKTDTYSVFKNVYVANVYVEVPAGKPDAGYPFEGPGLKHPPGAKPIPGAIQSVSPWNNSSVDSTAIPYEHNVFPSLIAGLPGHPVQNVHLENIEIVYAGGADKNKAFFPLDSLEKITEAETSYPEFSMYGELPVWGLYVRHAEGVIMKNIKISSRENDFRVPMILDDVKGAEMNGIAIPSATLPAILLNKVSGQKMENMQLPAQESKAILKK